MKRPRLTPLARQDLKEIGDYIAEDNAQAATAFVRRLKEKCLVLSRNPGIGRRRFDIDQSVRGASEGNYLIVYRQTTKGVEILRIIHGMRDLTRIVFPIA